MIVSCSACPRYHSIPLPTCQWPFPPPGITPAPHPATALSHSQHSTMGICVMPWTFRFPSSPSSYFPPISPPPLQPTPLRPPPSPPLSHHRYHLLPAVPISGGRGRSSPWWFPPPSIPTRTITKGKGKGRGKGKGQDWLLLHHHRPISIIILIIILHLRCNYLRNRAVPQPQQLRLIHAQSQE